MQVDHLRGYSLASGEEPTSPPPTSARLRHAAVDQSGAAGFRPLPF